MSWGYKHSVTSFAEELQSKKLLIKETSLGTKIYKSFIGDGILKRSVIWHDNRKTNFPSMLIIDHKAFNVDNLKTQKEIFKYAEEMLRQLKLISVL